MNGPLFVKRMQKNTITLSMFFVLSGAMTIFIVPTLIEQAHALTIGEARTYFIGFDHKFSNIKWNLEAGKWVETPRLLGDGWGIHWVTKGSGFFGGTERGTVEADLGPGRHVIFKWTNPDRGENHCLLGWTGQVYTLPCRITQGVEAHATYIVSSIRLP